MSAALGNYESTSRMDYFESSKRLAAAKQKKINRLNITSTVLTVYYAVYATVQTVNVTDAQKFMILLMATVCRSYY